MPEQRAIRIGAGGIIVREGKVLLVKFDDENGPHYNYPGGGHQDGESLRETAAREVKEETDADVEVGRPLVVAESTPHVVDHVYGETHFLKLYFECTLKPGSEPRLPETPDPNEIAVEWALLESLENLPDPVIPEISSEIRRALDTGQTQFFEDDGLVARKLSKK